MSKSSKLSRFTAIAMPASVWPGGEKEGDFGSESGLFSIFPEWRFHSWDTRNRSCLLGVRLILPGETMSRARGCSGPYRECFLKGAHSDIHVIPFYRERREESKDRLVGAVDEDFLLTKRSNNRVALT